MAAELALGVLTGRERAQAIMHLDRCGTCRERIRDLAVTGEELSGLLPGREPPARCASRRSPGADPAGRVAEGRRDAMTAPGSAGRPALAARLAGIGLAAAGVAIALGLHTPDATSTLFGQTGLGAVRLKSMLASIALGVAGLQVLLGAWMYRMLPLAGSPPRPVRRTHRITGFALFGFTVPIAAHCLITYGVQLTSPRVAVHSLAGCFFYGAFAAKVLLVHSRRLPGWALPAAGGTLAVAAAVLWYTSALWYYNGYQLPGM
jgi:Family of unknown function (DUF6529)